MSKTKNVIDLSSLDTVQASNAGTSVELRHPSTQEPLGMFITILGQDSDVFKDFSRHKFNENMRREQSARKRGKDANIKTAEDYEADSIDLLVACTVDWKNIVLDGSALQFSKENAKTLYVRFPWIRKQVDEAIGEVENFLPQ